MNPFLVLDFHLSDENLFFNPNNFQPVTFANNCTFIPQLQPLQTQPQYITSTTASITNHNTSINQHPNNIQQQLHHNKNGFHQQQIPSSLQNDIISSTTSCDPATSHGGTRSNHNSVTTNQTALENGAENGTSQPSEENANCDNADGTIAPISCDACRSNHRRCDRIRPSCQACKIRGIPCNYSMNFKRRAKFINNNRLKDEDVAILDVYYTESGYHMVSRTELEQFLLESYKCNGSYTTQDMKEMIALYYSIKATCECQMGQIDKAELSAKQAKEYLSKVFDCYTSMKVAGTYLNMCFYELWFERLHTAKFYFQTLLFFKEALENSKEETKNSIREHLIITITYLEETIFNIQDKKNLHERTFDRFLLTLPTLFSYLKTSDCMFGSDWDYYLKNPHLIDSTNCVQVNTLLQNLLRECKRYEQNNFGGNPVLDLYYDVMESGCTLALLSKTKEMNSMMDYVLERSATTIVNSINNPKFESMPFEILLHISFAAEYHLKKVREGIFMGSMNNCDYIEMLRTELRAYQTLQSRYKIAKTYFYGGIFKKLDDYFNNQ